MDDAICILIEKSLSDLQTYLRDLDTSIYFNDSAFQQAIISQAYQRFEFLRKLLAERLIKWQHDRAQALVPLGTQFQPNRLDKIRFWFKELAHSIDLFENLVSNVPRLDNSLRICILELFDNLIRSGFYVEEQPPQVLKTLVR